MTNGYRRQQAELQRRGAQGRFRKTRLADFGCRVVICPSCHAFNPYEPYYGDGPMTDPRDVWTRNRPTSCHACGASLDGEQEEVQ